MNFFSGENLFCLRGEKLIFSNLSFSLASGSALILKGPNGSGKSSLLRLMAGLLVPAAGSICWNSSDINANIKEHKDRLHFIGHLNAVKPNLTIYENIEFWANLRANKKDLNIALTEFGIAHLKNVAVFSNNVVEAV